MIDNVLARCKFPHESKGTDPMYRCFAVKAWS
jgi:hypothetical protein